jgi:YjbE family integral membrane protein
MEWFSALTGIIMVNVLLSGDNALVIALASHNLPKRQKRLILFWGSGGAIGLRIIMAVAAVYFLQIPYLQMAGGVFLLGIALNLAIQDKTGSMVPVRQKRIWEAVKTIIIADLVMSIDNVIAIAGIAQGNVWILGAGLFISIPIIIRGSGLIGRVLHRWPGVVMVGAAFLGWTAGNMMLSDSRIGFWFTASLGRWSVPVAAAAAVFAVGGWKYLKRAA